MNVKRTASFKAARRQATAEIRAQAKQALSRDGTKLTIILAMFTVAAMYGALFILIDAVFVLWLDEWAVNSGLLGSAAYGFCVYLLPSFLLMPVFAGFRMMMLDVCASGRADLRTLFSMYSSSYFHMRSVLSSFPTAIRVSVSFILVFAWQYLGPFVTVSPFLIFLAGAALLPAWLAITRMWSVTPYLELPETVKGCTIAYAKKAARKKYYSAELMRGTVKSFAGARLLSVVTALIYGVAAVYPELFLSKAFCALRTVNLINNERKGQ